ncbi:flavodoxin family protein [Salinispira pacifica]|uniref:Flavodoxin n=1 Tax=Salinispira pacifica TaxID=1307761 RepID=V5WE20_9SPIO|nr:flavodoxin family protein [Salinispira pacifica]AHC14038.1 Flavodoxin [Salinispira pacifica]
MHKGLIIYSSKTGNTKTVAEAIHRGLTPHADIASASDEFDTEGYAWILWGFWVDKGSANAEAVEVLESIRGKKIGVFGTLGAYPDSNHADDVRTRIRELVERNNKFLGEFLCMGKIDPRLTEMFKNFPADHPHAMTEERMARHQEAARHPNEDDCANALTSVREILAPILNNGRQHE